MRYVTSRNINSWNGAGLGGGGCKEEPELLEIASDGRGLVGWVLGRLAVYCYGTT